MPILNLYMNSARLPSFLSKYTKGLSRKGNVFLFIPVPFPHFFCPSPRLVPPREREV